MHKKEEVKKPVKLLNYTPHVVRILVGDKTINLPSMGSARSVPEDNPKGNINGIPVVTRASKPYLKDLPDPEDNVVYVVSCITHEVAKILGRTDCVAPDTHNSIRDKYGNIVAVYGFIG